MYSMIRIAIIIVILVGVFILIRNRTLKKSRSYIYVCALGLSVVISIFPFENFIYTFHSIEESFKYVNSEEITMVVEGESSAFVVSESTDLGDYNFCVIPKYNDGWKIGKGIDLKSVNLITGEDIVVEMFQYKNTTDFYIAVHDVNGTMYDIRDNLETIFQRVDEPGGSCTYYANILKYDDKYELYINGVVFPLL